MMDVGCFDYRLGAGWQGFWTDQSRGYNKGMACCLFGTQLNCLYSELGIVSGAIIEDGTRAVGEWIQASENGAKCGRGNFSIALSDSGDSFTGYYTCKNGTHREPWNERQFESFATPTEVQCGALQDPLNPVTINGRWGDGVTELQDVCIYSSDLRAEVSYQFNQLRSPGYLKAFAYLNQRVLNGRFHENYNQGVELLFAARNGSLGRIYWSTYPAQPVNIHDITDPGRHRYYYISKSPNVNQTANTALACIVNRNVKFIPYSFVPPANAAPVLHAAGAMLLTAVMAVLLPLML